MTTWHKLMWSEGDNSHRRNSPLCGRVPVSSAAATTDNAAVTCRWCRKIIDRAILLAEKGAVVSACPNPYHEYYPQYGVAPHECFYKKDKDFMPGQSTLLPKSEWPDNFVLEVLPGEDPDTIKYPSACGVYYCPTCKEGMPQP